MWVISDQNSSIVYFVFVSRVQYKNHWKLKSRNSIRDNSTFLRFETILSSTIRREKNIQDLGWYLVLSFSKNLCMSCRDFCEVY